MSAGSESVVLFVLPYSVSHLISSAGLITQQMGTECSVTKTEKKQTHGWIMLQHVHVCVRVHSDSTLEQHQFLSLSCVCPALCAYDLCITPVLIRHLDKFNSVNVELSNTWWYVLTFYNLI